MLFFIFVCLEYLQQFVYKLLSILLFQLMSQQTKLDALNESLKSADDQIAYQKRLNTQLELENQKLNAFTQKLLCKIKMSQLEMTDLREQCNEITKEASATKNITAKVYCAIYTKKKYVIEIINHIN